MLLNISHKLKAFFKVTKQSSRFEEEMDSEALEKMNQRHSNSKLDESITHANTVALRSYGYSFISLLRLQAG